MKCLIAGKLIGITIDLSYAQRFNTKSCSESFFAKNLETQFRFEGGFQPEAFADPRDLECSGVYLDV
jgi:hypothetical protein